MRIARWHGLASACMAWCFGTVRVFMSACHAWLTSTGVTGLLTSLVVLCVWEEWLTVERTEEPRERVLCTPCIAHTSHQHTQYVHAVLLVLSLPMRVAFLTSTACLWLLLLPVCRRQHRLLWVFDLWAGLSQPTRKTALLPLDHPRPCCECEVAGGRDALTQAVGSDWHFLPLCTAGPSPNLPSWHERSL